MDDPEADVVQQTITSLGQLKEDERFPWLLEKLADQRYRIATRDALAAYGPSALEPLRAILHDDQRDPAVRRSIPGVMAIITNQTSVDMLVEAYDSLEPSFTYPVLKALSKLRSRSVELQYDAAWIEEKLEAETRAFHQLGQALWVYREANGSAGVALLRKAMEEQQQQVLERIFRLLGLEYVPQDIYYAYLGYVSGRSATRASAVEFLDNVLRQNLKERLIPLLDPVSPTAAIDHGNRLFGSPMQTSEQVMSFLISNQDTWLRVCALFSLRGQAIGAHEAELLRAAEEDPHQVVRETASLVLGSTGAD